ncbi:MAG: hypothetical protein HOV97_05545 [Nonomuraea sp.]|nr:hypothetical protein [Nonomuraea sp.]
MPVTHVLQILVGTEWVMVGWVADTDLSKADLAAHGQALANSNPDRRYRLVTPSPVQDGEPDVIHEFVGVPEPEPMVTQADLEDLRKEMQDQIDDLRRDIEYLTERLT